MLRLAFLAIALAVLSATAASDTPDAHAPLRVAAEALDPATALVEWSPGTEPADAYRVYGVNGATLTLLVDTSDLPAPLALAAAVPAGYDTYAVSGVQANVESAPVLALPGAEAGCLYITWDPPGIHEKKCGKADMRRP